MARSCSFFRREKKEVYFRMIYVVRHGQTVWNLQKRKQGQMDSPLTLRGINQAGLISDILKKEILDFRDFQLVISPQWRCQQFSSIICENIGVKFSDCIVENDLKEHSFGFWEGLTEEEIESEFPGMLAKRYSNWWEYVVPGGESYELLSKRVEKVLFRYYNKKVIFVCHEMVSKVLRGNYLNMNHEDVLKLKHEQNRVFKLENNKVQILEKKEK